MKRKSNKVTGIIFAILGVLCIVFPIASSLWIELIVGAAFIVGAILAAFKIFPADGASAKLYWISLAILYGIGGAFMLLNPILGAMAIMLALGVIFLLEGIVALIYWGDRRSDMKYPGVMLLNALITLLLGVLVMSNLNSGVWFIGFLVGLDLIFAGISMFSIGEFSGPPQVRT